MLEILVRALGGNNNRQWLDLQITASVFEPTNESIIFGDTVTVAFKAGNKGNLSAGEVQIQSFTNSTEMYTQELETVSQNFQSLFLLQSISILTDID